MAEDLARSSGTPDEVIQTVLSQEFLTKCLRKAKFSADLLQDTLDACDINDLNALVLGSGLLSVTQASEKLFLMQDEANTVVTVCRKECLRAGVNFGDGAQLTPDELAEKDDEEPAPAPAPAPAAATPPAPSPVAAPAHPAIQIPPAPAHPPSNRFSPGAHDSKLQKQPSKSASAATTPTSTAATPTQATTSVAGPTTVASPTAAASEAMSKEATPPPTGALEQRPSVTSRDQPQADPPNSLVKPPNSASSIPLPPGTTTPSSVRSNIPKPSSTTPATPAAAAATPRERPAAKPVTRASPSTSVATPPTSGGGALESGNRSTVTPAMNGKHTASASSSAAKPPRPSSAPLSARASTTAPLGKDRPSSALATPPLQQSAKLPSYAKPTASHKARLLKEDSDVPSTSAPPPVTFASTTKPLRRLLYMPPRPSSAMATPEEKKEPKKPIFDNIRSNLLRPTAAFLAWSSGKSRDSKNVDLRASQTLQGSIRGPNSAPPKSREFSATTMLTPSMTQGPLRQTTTPEPFRLASTERHQKAQEELQKKKEEKARLESQIPKFKASPMPSPGFALKAPDVKRSMTAQTE